jgi:hypothetical protein
VKEAKMENALVKEDFLGKLNEVIVEIGNTREILIAGDFNSRTGRKINNFVVGPFGEEVINNNGDKLIDACEKNSLKIWNGYLNTRGYISTSGTKIHRSQNL